MAQSEDQVDTERQRPSLMPAARASGVSVAEQAMSADVLLKAVARQGHRIPSEPEQQRKLLSQLTHLHINGLHLHQLQSLRLCPRLQVLYLYDNQLTSIASIASITSNRLLTHLYIQNNRLQQLDGLQELGLLQKLYLQGNCLTCVDNLSACSRLEELHVSDQHWQQSREDVEIPKQQQQQQQQQQQHHKHHQQHHQQGIEEPQQCVQECKPQLASQQSAGQDAVCSSSRSSTAGDEPDQLHSMQGQLQSPEDTSSMMSPGLQFEPASLQAISCSLRVLYAANCGIHDPAPLAVLQKLRTLDLSGNSIGRLALLQPVLQRLQRLRVLDMRGNPCLQHELKYRDYVILVAADSLQTLDSEAVQASHRAFLLGLQLNRLKAQGRAEEQQQQQQGRKQQGQLQQQGLEQLLGQCLAGKAAAVSGSCVGVLGTGLKLHAARAAAVRPTAAGGFIASGARIGAVLGSTLSRAAAGDVTTSYEHT